MFNRCERFAMVLAWAVLFHSRHVRLGAVAFVRGETVHRIFAVDFNHHSVSSHLGDEPESRESSLSQAELISHYMNYSQLIYQLTSEMTSAGYAYKVDTDLRPDGSRGDLIISVKGYSEYS